MHNTTVVIVSYNTAELLQRAVYSIRRFHHDLPIIIVDGSDIENPCYEIAKILDNDFTSSYRPCKNIGHGRGMDFGIMTAETDYVMVMDSDAELIAPCLPQMESMMESNVFGVGKLVQVNDDGVNVDPDRHENPIPYLHPYFALINRRLYQRVPGFVHHGAPCIRTMQYLNNFKKYRIIDFDLTAYVKHDGRGTRALNPKEFGEGWE